MNNFFLQPVKIKASKILAVWLVIIHVGAIGCVALLRWGWQFQSLLILICLGSFWFNWRKQILFKTPYAVKAIRSLPNNNWRLFFHTAGDFEGSLLPHSVINKHFLLLHFSVQPIKKKISFVLLKDSIEKNLFRPLKLQILMENKK